MRAITEKAMDTSMQYDTEAAWKSVGEVLKNFAANMRWACVRMVGGVSIFQFSPIFLGRHSLMAGLRRLISFLEKKTLVPVFE